MGLSKFVFGIIICVINLAIAQFIPNYFSRLPQSTIELLIIGYIFLGLIAPFVGYLERD